MAEWAKNNNTIKKDKTRISNTHNRASGTTPAHDATNSSDSNELSNWSDPSAQSMASESKEEHLQRLKEDMEQINMQL